MAPTRRKTRIVCVSDTHNASPADGAFKLPKGDVLIHAGDLTKQGTYGELKKTLDWIDEADYEVKIIVPGNHDITLDLDFYHEHGLSFHNQHPQDSLKCLELTKSYTNITCLNHEAVVIRLEKEDGPRTSFMVFGSPYSPKSGLWAFSYDQDEGDKLWDKVPLNSDIVITHTPPNLHCDLGGDRRHHGCESLRQALWRVRPPLAICGHVHEGRGVDRVLWDLGLPADRRKEISTMHWQDPGLNNRKMSLVDLTSRSANFLQNAGSMGNTAGKPEDETPAKAPAFMPLLPLSSEDQDAHTGASDRESGLPVRHGDREAAEEKMNREETCIINAAITATSWPYKKRAARYNKPVVVDIDLPVRDRKQADIV